MGGVTSSSSISIYGLGHVPTFWFGTTVVKNSLHLCGGHLCVGGQNRCRCSSQVLETLLRMMRRLS